MYHLEIISNCRNFVKLLFVPTELGWNGPQGKSILMLDEHKIRADKTISNLEGRLK
jgi:hypothetical protein